jgi:signal transduction histidine kinase
VSAAEPDLSRLAELAGGLDLHEHRCLIYDTQEEQFAAALPFLRAGLERRERCLYIADENRADAVLSALRNGGTDVDSYLRNGALTIAAKQDTYLKHGRFDADLWIRFLSREIHEASSGKFSGMRTLLGEMTWALGGDIASDTLVEYESELNRFVRDHDVRVLCQYNRNRFSPEIILGIIRTHPVVVYSGIVCNNPYYIPPDEFRKPDQALREIERLLNNILTWQHSFDQLRALTAHLQGIREEERKRVAREIHDELGQALTAIKLDLASLVRELPAGQGQEKKGESILTLVDQAIQVVRRISTELRPGILDDLGLVAAVEWAVREFETRTGTKCRVDLPAADITLDQERDTAIFRIVQETLTNVARHANATQVDVLLKIDDGEVTLEVRDNGRGITDEQLAAGKSLGILGMRERAHLLGGTLSVIGVPGKGTVVRVRIPDNHGRRIQQDQRQ